MVTRHAVVSVYFDNYLSQVSLLKIVGKYDTSQMNVQYTCARVLVFYQVPTPVVGIRLGLDYVCIYVCAYYIAYANSIIVEKKTKNVRLSPIYSRSVRCDFNRSASHGRGDS